MLIIDNYPIRVARRDDTIFLFNTKTCSTIGIDEDAYILYQILINYKELTDTEINKLSQKHDIDFDSLKSFVSFLYLEEFLYEEKK